MRLEETNARLTELNERLSAEIRERKSTEDALRKSEQDLVITLNSIGDAVIATDTAGRVTRMNPVAERLTGWPMAEALHRPLTEVFRIVNELTRKPVEAPVSKVLREGAVVGLANHTVLISRYGTEYPIADSGAPIRLREGAEIIGVVLVFRDETDKRQAEKELSRFKQAVEDASDAIGMSTPDGRYYYQNRAMTEMFGLPVKEVDGETGPASTLYVDENVGREVFAAIMRGDRWEGEVQMLDRNRRKMDVFLRAYAIKSQQGKIIALVGLHTNIMERKRLQEAQRISEEKFRALVENTNDLVWEVDRNGRYTYVSPHVREMLGHEPEAFVGKTPFDFMPPEEARRVGALFSELVRRRAEIKSLENVALHHDGHRVILETSGKPFFDSAGNFNGYRGIDRDITARKQAEGAIKTSEERYRALVETTGTGYVIIDTEAAILILAGEISGGGVFFEWWRGCCGAKGRRLAEADSSWREIRFPGVAAGANYWFGEGS